MWRLFGRRNRGAEAEVPPKNQPIPLDQAESEPEEAVLMALEIEPADAESLLTSASLIDVREPWEYQRERLKGAYHIPLGQIPRRVDEIRALVSERPSAIVYCQHGIRSLKAVEFLHQAGIEKPRSLRGGMAEWCARGGVNVLRGPEAGEAGRDH